MSAIPFRFRGAQEKATDLTDVHQDRASIFGAFTHRRGSTELPPEDQTASGEEDHGETDHAGRAVVHRERTVQSILFSDSVEQTEGHPSHVESEMSDPSSFRKTRRSRGEDVHEGIGSSGQGVLRQRGRGC